MPERSRSEIADAVRTVFGQLSGEGAEEFERLALREGILRRCACGWNVAIDQNECDGPNCGRPMSGNGS